MNASDLHLAIIGNDVCHAAPCLQCDGDGEREQLDRTGFVECYTLRPCPECNGTGRRVYSYLGGDGNDFADAWDRTVLRLTMVPEEYAEAEMYLHALVDEVLEAA